MAQFDTIFSIWRNSSINTRRMSLALSDASTQRVLWKIWHDNQATPIIFQMRSRNITALHCTASYKARCRGNNNNIWVLELHWRKQLLCACLCVHWWRWIWFVSRLLSAFNCSTSEMVFSAWLWSKCFCAYTRLVPSNETYHGNQLYMFTCQHEWPVRTHLHLFSREWLPRHRSASEGSGFKCTHWKAKQYHCTQNVGLSL